MWTYNSKVEVTADEKIESLVCVETTPIYVCMNIDLALPKAAQVCQRFGIDGKDGIRAGRLSDEERREILEGCSAALENMGLTYSSCYVDNIYSDKVNLGVYLENEGQLKSLTEKVDGKGSIFFVADLYEEGIYVIREEDAGGPGHSKSEPHLVEGAVQTS